MAVEITARHMDATEALQGYARRKAEELMEAFTRVEHTHVILDVQKHLHMAEVVTQVRNRGTMEAAVTSPDNMKAAVDAAMDKIERQLRRLNDKVHDHKAAMRHEEQDKTRRM